MGYLKQVTLKMRELIMPELHLVQYHIICLLVQILLSGSEFYILYNRTYKHLRLLCSLHYFHSYTKYAIGILSD